MKLIIASIYNFYKKKEKKKYGVVAIKFRKI